MSYRDIFLIVLIGACVFWAFRSLRKTRGGCHYCKQRDSCPWAQDGKSCPLTRDDKTPPE